MIFKKIFKEKQKEKRVRSRKNIHDFTYFSTVALLKFQALILSYARAVCGLQDFS